MIEETATPTEELPAIAIVGMAGRFPQAADINEFWSHLCAGRECLSRFSAAELRAAGVPQALLSNSRYVPVNGLLADIELFDAGFFGMNPREASITDPQHRLLLELAWNALEDCGHDPARYPGAIGVYAGCGLSSYLLNNLWSNRAELADVGELSVRMANSQEYLATRVSYKLNLTGPSVSINTACSTSLVAVHMACDALLNFQCDMALGGGISIQVPQVKGYVYEEGGILSPDGHCRAFDAGAQGTVSGNGGALVVLKRLADALDDGDTIYAVVRGSAINNDGADKAGYTAPSVSGQARVIAEAQAMAGIEAETIGYLEAHGTGTPLGDPIEFAALTQVFRNQTARAQFCALGSVKTNVGHLDEAAGVTGLIKTVLSLYHRRIPPSLHFKRPNPEIDAAASPFYVNTELSDWPAPANGAGRRAAVSSFGIGGTNAHLLLEETPARATKPWARPVQLLPYSARGDNALGERGANLATWMASHPDQDLADIAYTLQVGRRAFAWRKSVLGANADEAQTALRQAQSTTPPTPDPPPVVFMFSGQGSQHPGMARALYEHEPVFRHWLDTCAERLRPSLGRDLRHLLYPESAAGERRAAAELQRTDLAQPALFALEYSLAQLWMHWGIRPQAMIGHSIGEYVCACLSGVLELDAALTLVTVRGRLMQSAPEGAMLSVPLDPDSLKRYLNNGIEIAAINAPDRCVVAGSAASIFDLTERLRVAEIEARPLNVSHAFHSASMTPMLDDFNTALQRHSFRSPQVPYVSNLTGNWIGPDEAGDPAYYVRHLRRPVRFAAGLSRLLKAHPGAVFVEIGPGQALTQLARRCAPPDTPCVPSLPQSGSTMECHRVLLAGLGQLWERGAEVDWPAFAEAGRRRVSLPGYPFQRQRHWIEARPESVRQATAEQAVDGPSTAAKQMLDKWCYVPRWQAKAAPPDTPPDGHWLLFTNNDANDLLAETLRQAGCRVTVVQANDRWATLGPGRYCVRPQSREDYLALLEDMHEAPSQILWLWSYGPAPGWLAEDWCFALLALVQALDSQPSPPRLSVVVSGLAAVAAGEGAQLSVEKGTLSGLLRSASLEYPQLAIRLIDFTSTALKDVVNVLGLITICQDESSESFVAWRKGQPWISQYETVPPSDGQGFRLRRGGVYLITGGVGGIGLTLAGELARNWQARLILLGRTALPPEPDWANLLGDPSTSPALRLTLQRLQALRDDGAELLIEVADVAKRDQLERVINRARERFGSIHGVIHAAGVADGALLARQTRDGMAEVLAAKVAGTRLLSELLADERLDFCLLCSALSGVTGAPGQSAYCASNSFLDHFAQAAPAPWPLLAIDWDAWREVGMAVKNRSNAETETPGVPVHHPLLQTRLAAADGRTIYKARLSEGEHWVLAEHRLGNKALLPGTAYLELACAAARDLCSTTALDVQDCYLLQPLMLDASDVSNLEVTLTPQGEHYAFQISSQTHDRSVELHAEGRITPMPSLLLATPDTPQDLASLAPEDRNDDDRSLARRLAHFGPRWQCLKQLGGPNRQFAELSLDEDYAAETEDYLLHPALMDVATGFPVLDKHYDSALLPFAYRRIRLYAPLPPKLRSELRAAREEDDGLHLDLRLMDQQGRVLAEIEDYHLRKTSRTMPGENYHLVLGQADQLDGLRVEPCGRPAPGPGMVEIEISAAGLNFKDVLFALGMLPEAETTDWQFGLECAGRIRRVGEGVPERFPGEAVVAYAAGCLRGYAVIPAAQVQPLPAGLSFVTAASLPAAFMTAYYSLVSQARLQKGETVLIHAAAGGVGLAAVQIARSIGAEVLATAGSPRKRSFLRELGVAKVFDSRSAEFVEGVREHTAGRGVNVVLNSLSGDLLLKSVDCLAPYGRFLELGVRDVRPGTSLDLRHFAKAISFNAISVGPDMPGFGELFKEVLDQFRAGDLKPLPLQVFPLAASAAAFQQMARAQHIGKVVIALRPEAGSVAEPLIETIARGLSCADGVSAFHHALAAGQPQLIVSTVEPFEIINRLRGLKLSDYYSVAPGASDRPHLNTPYVAPQGETETRLAPILEKLLGLKGIGRDDDFFALGGDSLIGTRYIAQINRDLGSRLTLRHLFEGATIAALSARAVEPANSPAPRILPAPQRSDYPLTHAQKRLWILAQNPAASVAYNMCYSLSLNGVLNPTALVRAFGLVVERHEILRTAFITVNGEPRQQPRPAQPFELPVRDLRNESDPLVIVGEELRAEAMVPFNLDQPPLVRARLLRTSDQEHILLVSMHHIIADGLSLNVLLPELHEFYAALCANRAANLPPLSIQYKDFAVWQQQQLTGEAMQAHREYWLAKLGGDLPVPALPTDRPRPPLQEFSGGHVLRRLPAPARDTLHRHCQEHGVTLFMLLIATVKVLLHQITGQDDILIGSPVAGHEHAELEGQIGYYLNNVVLRDTVRRREPFTALLQRVRNTVAEALTHQDYPFDVLIGDLAIKPAPGHSPLFDVQLNLMPEELRSLHLGDLVVADAGMDNETTIFDLNFMFSDRPHGLAVEIDYSNALFNADRIERLGDHLLLLLTAIAEQPESTVRVLCSLLEEPSSPAEKAEFLAAALNLDEEF